MDFKAIQALTADDMAKVNETIQAQLNSDVSLINQLGFYIVSGGGKRLRPMLAILSARALGYQGEAHTTAAAFIEFIHTATLLHDDVVDESDMRRGKETANAAFGNAASVLVGDYIYTRSFQMMTKLGSLRILELMSDSVNVISEGEVQQLMNCNDPDTTEESYMQVIYSKTARLFEAATQIGAILNDAPKEIEVALQNYGKYLGTAFQLIDDVMDYTSDGKEMGKNVGDDLAEGKPTLPLLHAMRHGNDQQAAMIRDAIEHSNGMDRLNEILAAMDQSGSLDYTTSKALEEADKAIEQLSILPESDYKEALIALAHLAVKRTK
ncbi:octaprenyl diphosphate synthase [Vibrio genomosp. F10]|uniref:Octaprenyl diphosphate synthase n=2 Tax=Vibrio genomosp. F10 TaxID=723171 RepID=A0A1B9R3I6_9VIBR|nr:octaprenyl diphosphate synthase [Vibrio genomosp. F10]OCH78755.1 octaprenyl diphosphate synthase [Vibrio genomosp. F10]OEE32044.1 octaprenyl diphosphate synthase [Vibrio genomosp. F10 str. ZF-129]OEE83028.1 octaprenyl diphosphate synthase [Vibrio genomosp. F10 str. 9ZD137]OEE96351.1 octaprenyl diphosphate synthase [Vibrio genomosp. F10 str. 9ZC157]OEF06432.1 octaprenyl diphosphate synthase [Vibrio genomosp. F10 str. 9ZB36]